MKAKFLSMFKAPFKKNKRGQSLVEYGLILALVSVVAITVLQTMGGQIEKTINQVNTKLETAVPDSSTNTTNNP